MDARGLERDQRLERINRDQGVGIVELGHAGAIDTRDPKEVVSHGAVRGWNHEHDFVAHADFELARHLVSNRNLVSARARNLTVLDPNEEATHARLELDVDAHDHGRGRRFTRAHEAAGVDPRCGSFDRRIRNHRFEERGHVGAVAITDGVVEASLGPVVGSVDLQLPRQNAGAVFDHLGFEPVGPSNDEDDGEVPCAETKRGDERPFAVTAEIPPADPPPGRRRHHPRYRRRLRVWSEKKDLSKSMSNSRWS